MIHHDRRMSGLGLVDLRADERRRVVSVGDRTNVVYTYAPTGEGATGPWDFLRGRDRYVQADAASVFDRVYNGAAGTAVEVGCWTHARRRLVELQPTDCRAAYPLQLIARLYRIEHLADAKNLSPPDRALLRQERSFRVLEKLQHALACAHLNEPPAVPSRKPRAMCSITGRP